MTADELKAEVAIDLDLLQQVVDELEALRRDVAGRVKTAAAAFMAQFYSGVENILKHLSRFHEVALPVGDNWHLELFNRSYTAGQVRPETTQVERRHPAPSGGCGGFGAVVRPVRR